MKAESQPTRSIPRMHTLSVGDILDALKDAPRDGIVKCETGGCLEAGIYAPWAEVRVEEREGRCPIIHTRWQ